MIAVASSTNMNSACVFTEENSLLKIHFNQHIATFESKLCDIDIKYCILKAQQKVAVTPIHSVILLKLLIVMNPSQYNVAAIDEMRIHAHTHE